MFSKQIAIVSVLVGLLVTPTVGAHAAGGGELKGTVWLCHSTRPGSANRPTIYAFHADGLLTIESGTNIVSNRQSNDRGGLIGYWTDQGDGIHTKLVEMLYKDGTPVGEVLPGRAHPGENALDEALGPRALAHLHMVADFGALVQARRVGLISPSRRARARPRSRSGLQHHRGSPGPSRRRGSPARRDRCRRGQAPRRQPRAAGRGSP
jgi:hypothetical protein